MGAGEKEQDLCFLAPYRKSPPLIKQTEEHSYGMEDRDDYNPDDHPS